MENSKFGEIKNNVQEIIDCIATKDFASATIKLEEVKFALEKLLDITPNDEDIMEISRYKILLNQLLRKMSF